MRSFNLVVLAMMTFCVAVTSFRALSAEGDEEIVKAIKSLQDAIDKSNPSLKNDSIQEQLKKLRLGLVTTAPLPCDKEVDPSECSLKKIQAEVDASTFGQSPATAGHLEKFARVIITLGKKLAPSARVAGASLDAIGKLDVKAVDKDPDATAGDDEKLLVSLNAATTNVLKALNLANGSQIKRAALADTAAQIATQLNVVESQEPTNHAEHLAGRLLALVTEKEGKIGFKKIADPLKQLIVALKKVTTEPPAPTMQITWAAYGDLYWAIEEYRGHAGFPRKCVGESRIRKGHRQKWDALAHCDVPKQILAYIDHDELFRVGTPARPYLDVSARRQRYCSATQALAATCNGKLKCGTAPSPDSKAGNGETSSPQGNLPEIAGNQLCGYDPVSQADPSYKGAFVVYRCTGANHDSYAILRGKADALLSCAK